MQILPILCHERVYVTLSNTVMFILEIHPICLHGQVLYIKCVVASFSCVFIAPPRRLSCSHWDIMKTCDFFWSRGIFSPSDVSQLGAELRVQSASVRLPALSHTQWEELLGDRRFLTCSCICGRCSLMGSVFIVCPATPGCYETTLGKGRCGGEIYYIRKNTVVEQC